jgi:hypothetical protein
VGGSTIPHGRFTATAKERLWNVLWNERELRPKAQVILRGHVHYATFCGEPGWVAMTLPALQGMGTRYGGRVCSGTVHWGAVIFDVNEDGTEIKRGSIWVPINTVNFTWRLAKVLIAGPDCKTVKSNDVVMFPNDKGIQVANMNGLKNVVFLNESRIFGVCEPEQ